MLKIGDLLDGKYKILNEIGHGGMSTVYLALNERANKTWAVKEVRKSGSNDTEIITQNLVAETEMLKKLHHDRLVSIVDVIDTKESFIVVMDYIEGRSLQEILNSSGPQDPKQVVEWAKQLTDVLGYLHARKPPIIYRDMKPANVMLKPNNEIVLIDFGTAREHKETKDMDTVYLGTRGYAAPEQFGGKGQTDARTDIYTLGATMYHLLTGYSPADTHFVIYPVGQLRPELAGSGIEAIVAKCCQPNPEDRYQTCADLMFELMNVDKIGEEERKKQTRNWNIFLSCVAVFILGLVGILTSSVLESSTRSNSYASLVDQARKLSDDNEAINKYGDAISLNATDNTAYDGILDVIWKDDEVTIDEYRRLESILQGTGERGSRGSRNIELFKRTNEYPAFAFKLGEALYVSTSIADKSMAITYFEDCTGTEYEAMSNVFRLLCQTISSESIDPTGLVNRGVSLSDYWGVLYSLLVETENIEEEVKGENSAIALYRKAAYDISNSIVDMKSKGITENEIRKLLDTATDYINGLAVNDDNRDRIENAKKMISEAYDAIAASARIQ